MKRRYFSYVITVLLLLPIFSINTSFANENESFYPSSWAAQKIAISVTAGIIPEGFDQQPFNASITRKDFCELLLNTCRTFEVPLPAPPPTATFSDTTDINAEGAYMLGLTQGTATGIFSPELPLTREMAAVMLSRLRMLFQYTSGGNNRNIEWTSTGVISYDEPMDERQATQTLSKYAIDGNLVSDWARINMADVYTRGILAGIGNGQLDPKSYITREQAALLSLNVLTYSGESQILAAGVSECVLPIPSGIFLSASYFKSDVYLRWNDIPFAQAYDVTVYKEGEPTYTARIDSNNLDLRTISKTYNRDTNSYDMETFNNPLYESIFGNNTERIHATLEVVPVNNNGEPSIFSLTHAFIIEPWVNKNEMIFGDPEKTAFASTEEAMLHMTQVNVNVWRLTNSGTKIPGSMTITVNKNVADGVKNIFADIYNGSERFPIKNCGGYGLRSGPSEHPGGTAIDINYEENYYVEWGGKILVGKLWEPGINPYSIPPNGDVVSAFNRYGWHWSPDMKWPNAADYMHFSLGGK